MGRRATPRAREKGWDQSCVSIWVLIDLGMLGNILVGPAMYRLGYSQILKFVYCLFFVLVNNGENM